MQILAFTDTHERLEHLREVERKAKEADLIVCAGDFTVFEHKTREMLKRFDALGKTVLLIHGNHEWEENIEQLCDAYEHVIFLHERYYEEMGVTFVGYGGGGFAQRDERLEQISDDLGRYLRNGVLIVHQPPHKTALDELPGFGHVGSISIRSLIRKHKPHLIICGHLHENFHKHDRIGTSRIINPGPDGELISIGE